MQWFKSIEQRWPRFRRNGDQSGEICDLGVISDDQDLLPKTAALNAEFDADVQSKGMHCHLDYIHLTC